MFKRSVYFLLIILTLFLTLVLLKLSYVGPQTKNPVFLYYYYLPNCTNSTNITLYIKAMCIYINEVYCVIKYIILFIIPNLNLILYFLYKKLILYITHVVVGVVYFLFNYTIIVLFNYNQNQCIVHISILLFTTCTIWLLVVYLHLLKKTYYTIVYEYKFIYIYTELVLILKVLLFVPVAAIVLNNLLFYLYRIDTVYCELDHFRVYFISKTEYNIKTTLSFFMCKIIFLNVINLLYYYIYIYMQFLHKQHITSLVLLYLIVILFYIICIGYVFKSNKKLNLLRKLSCLHTFIKGKIQLLHSKLVNLRYFNSIFFNNSVLLVFTYLWVYSHYINTIIVLANYVITDQLVNKYYTYIICNTNLHECTLYNPFVYYTLSFILVNYIYIGYFLFFYVILLVSVKLLIEVLVLLLLTLVKLKVSLNAITLIFNSKASNHIILLNIIIFIFTKFLSIVILVFSLPVKLVNVTLLLCDYMVNMVFNFIFTGFIQVYNDFACLLDHYIRAASCVIISLTYLVVKLGSCYLPPNDFSIFTLNYKVVLASILVILVFTISVMGTQDLNKFYFEIYYRKPKEAILYNIIMVDTEIVLYNEKFAILLIYTTAVLTYIKLILLSYYCIFINILHFK